MDQGLLIRIYGVGLGKRRYFRMKELSFEDVHDQSVDMLLTDSHRAHTFWSFQRRVWGLGMMVHVFEKVTIG